MKPVQVLAALAVAPAAAAAALLTVTSDHESSSGLIATLAVIVGCSFVASGLVAWCERPENRLGPAMVITGFLWFASFLGEANDALPFTIGTALENAFFLGFVYMVFSFPSGRITRRLDLVLFAGAVFTAQVIEIAWLLFAEPEAVFCDGCPGNVLRIATHNGLASTMLDAQRLLGVGFSVVTAVLLVARWRAASVALRRAVAPVLWAAAALFLALALKVVNDIAGEPMSDVTDLLFGVAFAATPVAVLVVLMRERLARGAVATLVVELGEESRAPELDDALARALGDPSLQLAYWVPASAGYVTADGRPVELPAEGDEERAVTLVERADAPMAALIHDPALSGDLIESVCAAAGLALENQRLQAELRARLEELRASRARLVEATEAERRRIERDLHDGAQQRLVSIGMTLGLAEAKLGADPATAGSYLQEARESLQAALKELRELSHGIHPAVLSERGLGAALEELVRMAAVPVSLRADDARLPEAVEGAAYFVVSESLANIAKHAHATEATVRAAREGDALVLEISDDGIGGAQPGRGSGLRGLVDRVEALGGRLTVSSPPGRGTTLRAELPCDGGG